MNDCPHCGFRNPDGIHICLNCASSLKMKCQKCNAEVPFENSFCGQCGAPVASTDGIARDQSPTYSPNLDLQERMLRNLRTKMPSSMVNKFMQELKRPLWAKTRGRGFECRNC